MFKGLSAFPLTPLSDNRFDENAFINLIVRLVKTGVGSVGVLGSTGNYAYLSRETRKRVTQVTVETAEDIPVIAGVSSLSTQEVLTLAEEAQKTGVSGLLVSPFSYQTLTDDEVYGLYESVSRNVSVPVCVYDNPGTTHFTFSDELHARIAELPYISSVKIPPVSSDDQEAKNRVTRLRNLLPCNVSIGISGDASGARGLIAGCDLWYSALAGTFPEVCQRITAYCAAGEHKKAQETSASLAELWALFARYGSLRVTAELAIKAGLVATDCLPLPLLRIPAHASEKLDQFLPILD